MAGPGNKLNDGLEAQSSNASITVSDYGEWVVRVEACNAAGCGRHLAQRFRVAPAPEPAPEPTPEPTSEPTPEPPPGIPASPTGLRLVADPGSLRAAAAWDAAAGATTYRLSWRLVQQNFLSKDLLTTSAVAAPITLSGQGD